MIIPRLTERQSETLSLIKKGLRYKNIAYEMGISEATVKVHVRNIYRMTGTTSRGELMAKLNDDYSGPHELLWRKLISLRKEIDQALEQLNALSNVESCNGIHARGKLVCDSPEPKDRE